MVSSLPAHPEALLGKKMCLHCLLPCPEAQRDTVWEKAPGNLHHLLDGPEAPLSMQATRVLWPFPALEANLQVIGSQKAHSKTLFILGTRKHIGNAILLLQIEPATSHEPAWEKLEKLDHITGRQQCGDTRVLQTRH